MSIHLYVKAPSLNNLLIRLEDQILWKVLILSLWLFVSILYAYRIICNQIIIWIQKRKKQLENDLFECELPNLDVSSRYKEFSLDIGYVENLEEYSYFN